MIMTCAGEELISVIIPVYNVERFVEDCLESVAAQTYENLEVIIVDDGSTDRSGLICDRYAAHCPSMRVIHQTNQGLSAARNAGMDLMHGEWVAFIDSDDYIHPDMIRTLYRTAVRENVRLVRCDYQDTFTDLQEMQWDVPESAAPVPVRRIRPADQMREYLEEKTLSVVWACLYHRSIVSDLRFIAGRNYEDVVFMAEVFGRIDVLCRIDAAYCGYRRAQGSITRSAPSRKSLDFCVMMQKRIRMIRDYFPELLDLAERCFWSKTINLYNAYLSYGKREEADVLLHEVKKNYLPELLPWKAVVSRRLPFPDRLMLLGCKLSFQAACAVKKKAIYLAEKRCQRKS